jgi:hypothetical protein
VFEQQIIAAGCSRMAVQIAFLRERGAAYLTSGTIMDSRNIYRLRACTTAMIATLMLLASTSALADPPMRVARLAYIDGAVSFSPAGEDEWVLAQVNRPFSTGDRIWSDTGSRVELQIGDASVRLGASTSASILNLDDRVAQVQLAQGVLNLRVREAYGGQAYEVDTPNLAFTVRQSGEYRIEVDPDGKATTVTCFNGEAEVYGESASYIIGARQSYRFTGTDLRDYESLALAAPDEFDRWASERDRRTERSVSARYVAPELVGYSDLDDYGTWSTVADYGPVWFPTRLDAGWVPYRDGHWAWIDPWGWTWVDNEPWGFAPFHYGRWAFVRERWCWVPGPRTVRPVYAPALVAFVGGSNFSLSIASGPAAGVAWFPLGPGEVYRPAYQVSRNYFTNVNVTNTRVSVTTVTNVYNNPSTNIIYRNRELARAVTAVPAAAFAGGHQVAQSAVPISREIVARAPVTDVAAVAPTRASLAPGNGARRGREAGRPPANALTRQVVAKNAPPPVASFSSRESQLAARPGKPIEPAPAAAAKAAPAASGANVKVLAPSAPANAPTRAENPRGASTQSIPRTNATAAPPGKAGEAAGGPSPQPNVPQPPERGKALAQEAQRDAPPQANVPRPPETPKGPAQPALRTPPPQASVPRPAESPRGPLQEATRRPAPQASVPRSPEAARVAPPEPRAPVQANVVRAPERAIREEPPRAAQPEAQTRQPEAPSERSMRPPPHQANVARPPEAPRAAAQQRPPSPPPQAQVRPQEPSRAPPPQVVRAAPPQPSAPRAPEPPKPPPQAAAHAPPPQANLARAPEPQRTAAAYREEGKGAEEKKQEPKR